MKLVRIQRNRRRNQQYEIKENKFFSKRDGKETAQAEDDTVLPTIPSKVRVQGKAREHLPDTEFASPEARDDAFEVYFDLDDILSHNSGGCQQDDDSISWTTTIKNEEDDHNIKQPEETASSPASLLWLMNVWTAMESAFFDINVCYTDTTEPEVVPRKEPRTIMIRQANEDYVVAAKTVTEHVSETVELREAIEMEAALAKEEGCQMLLEEQEDREKTIRDARTKVNIAKAEVDRAVAVALGDEKKSEKLTANIKRMEAIVQENRKSHAIAKKLAQAAALNSAEELTAKV